MTTKKELRTGINLALGSLCSTEASWQITPEQRELAVEWHTETDRRDTKVARLEGILAEARQLLSAYVEDAVAQKDEAHEDEDLSTQNAAEALREVVQHKAEDPKGAAEAMEEHATKLGLAERLAVRKAERESRGGTTGVQGRGAKEPSNPLTIIEPVVITFTLQEGFTALLHPDGNVTANSNAVDGKQEWKNVAALEKQITGKTYAKPWENWTFDRNGEAVLIDHLRKTPTFSRRMLLRSKGSSLEDLRAKRGRLQQQLALVTSQIADLTVTKLAETQTESTTSTKSA